MSELDDIPPDVAKEARAMFKRVAMTGAARFVHEYMARAIMAERERAAQTVMDFCRQHVEFASFTGAYDIAQAIRHPSGADK